MLLLSNQINRESKSFLDTRILFKREIYNKKQMMEKGQYSFVKQNLEFILVHKIPLKNAKIILKGKLATTCL